MRGVVETLLKKWEDGSVKKAGKVSEAWQKSVWDEALKKTRPVSIKKGTLTVIVENSSWLYRVSLEKKKILDRFNENYDSRKKADQIKLRIGNLNT